MLCMVLSIEFSYVHVLWGGVVSGGFTMLQSIYADRLSDEVLAVSASPVVRTDDSDVKSNLDTCESSANREPCDNPTRMSDAPISHKSGFVCRCFAVADGKVNLSCPAIRCAVKALVMVSPICWTLEAVANSPRGCAAHYKNRIVFSAFIGGLSQYS